MAAAAKELRYDYRYAVDGSLAYDLDWAVRERELRHAGEAPHYEERTATRQRAREQERVYVRERQDVSVFSVVGTVAVIAMALVMLYSYIQLTLIAAETVELKNELAVLQAEEISLTAEYEQMFDMSAVKEAASAAGMSKPGSSQVCYLDLSGADSAVVYQQTETSMLSRVLTSLHHGMYAVVEYFD